MLDVNQSGVRAIFAALRVHHAYDLAKEVPGLID